MITVKQLQIFSAIAQTGSITKAAKNLNLTQPAVSAALSTLEGQLQVKLFDRLDRKIALNDNGRRFFPEALSLVDKVNTMEKTFSKEKNLTGNIKIAASTTIGNYILPPIMAKFKTAYPEVKLSLSIANTDSVIEQIAHYDADVGFIEGYCLHSNIHAHAFQEDELIFIVNDTHPLLKKKHLTPQDLANYPFVIREQGSGSRQIFEEQALPVLGHNVEIFLELGGSSAIKAAIKHSNAIGCISKNAYTESEGLSIITAKGISLNRTFLLLQNKRLHVSRLLEEWLDWMYTAGKRK
ncbi:LysR substrate-binding domain-containing protein [Fangia hongkongensis]|uniref:LysR substrate-binding domain-containing protein n=1 Tax=Fangia hongkongensis TaxID=270495 RepID=UPI00035EEC42|nr:LysR substrate-binding domain-containing protein [Fangia hongkongensis]MBK2125767.1 LysR family transcriptional regulator [Fangia hongkongensis]